MKTTHNLQILFKEWWKSTNSGGKVRDYVKYTQGVDILRPALLEEIVPGLKLWRRSILKPNEFYETMFRPEVSWSTICDIYKTKTIYIERASITDTDESPEGQDQGGVQSSGHEVQRSLFNSQGTKKGRIDR